MGKGRHDDRLERSKADDVTLCEAVLGRYIKLRDFYQKQHHLELRIPSALDPDFRKWEAMVVRFKCMCGSSQLAFDSVRQMFVAHKENKMPMCAVCGRQGDYQHRASEMKALQAIAQWMLNVKNRLSNQPQVTQEWNN